MNIKSITVTIRQPCTRGFLIKQRDEMDRRLKQELPSTGDLFMYPMKYSVKLSNTDSVVLMSTMRWVHSNEVKDGSG